VDRFGPQRFEALSTDAFGFSLGDSLPRLNAVGVAQVKLIDVLFIGTSGISDRCVSEAVAQDLDGLRISAASADSGCRSATTRNMRRTFGSLEIWYRCEVLELIREDGRCWGFVARSPRDGDSCAALSRATVIAGDLEGIHPRGLKGLFTIGQSNQPNLHPSPREELAAVRGATRAVRQNVAAFAAKERMSVDLRLATRAAASWEARLAGWFESVI
jgi:hypothetical protein